MTGYPNLANMTFANWTLANGEITVDFRLLARVYLTFANMNLAHARIRQFRIEYFQIDSRQKFSNTLYRQPVIHLIPFHDNWRMPTAFPPIHHWKLANW